MVNLGEIVNNLDSQLIDQLKNKEPIECHFYDLAIIIDVKKV